MQQGKVDVIVDSRNAVGESPVWIAGEQALYWVDIPARSVWRWSSQTGKTARWTLPQQVGCIASAEGGGWVCGVETGIAHASLSNDGTVSSFELLASVQHALPNMRFNDGRCDRQGRFRAGTMFTDMAAARAAGAVYAVQGAGTLEMIADGLLVPNGMAFSPDGRTMYLSDSHPHSRLVWAFDYDVASGLPSGRRVFVDMNHFPGRPDGAAVDADGCYWTCANDAGLLHRFTPAGKLDRSIALPVKKPAMCAFGGADLRTLYVTSIRPAGTDLSDQPLAGAVFALRPGVQGLAEAPCRGLAFQSR